MSLLLKQRYQIVEVLSEAGGFGQTFLAKDTDTPSRRKCVIKKLRPITETERKQFDSETAILKHIKFVQERFHREAAILERLGDFCDQIPKLYAYFAENQEFYLVQELIDGLTLKQKLQREGTLDENTVRGLLWSLLNVLEYVHQQNIVHRDIKPDNIILRQRDNEPVLIDFGIVKEVLRVGVDGNPTSSVMAGTPGYTAPEQAAGRPVFASDLYSLGATAIYLLTGKNPQQMTNLATGDIAWRQYAPQVSSNLAAVLNKATESHARDRYQTAAEMRQKLHDYQQSLYGQETILTFEKTIPFAESSEITIISLRLIPYRKGDKWGFCDSNKKIVIELKYDETSPFSEGLASVELNGAYGYIDKVGREITPIKYEYVSSFSEGLALVKLNDKWGFIDKTGREIIPIKYDDAHSFSEVLAHVKLNGKHGLIDKTGREVIPIKYDYASSFSEGLALVGLKGKRSFIDKTGREIIRIKYDYYVSPFREGLAFVGNDKLSEHGYIDKTGREVIPIKYKHPHSYRAGGLFSAIHDYMFIEDDDAVGQKIIPIAHALDFLFHEGLARVNLNYNWGYIDKTGREVIPIKYGYATPFDKGLASVELNHKCSYIDKTGQEILSIEHGYADTIKEGLARLGKPLASCELLYNYGYINKTGREVIPVKYNHAYSFSEGLARVLLNGKYGFIGRDGTEYFED